MKMQQIIIQTTEDLINDQDAKQRIKQRTQKMGGAGQFNEHLQPPEGFDRIKQIFDGDANAAWYWLTVPNDALDGEKPLALLHKGEVARVEADAKGYLEGDFG
ncbi:MAG: MbcA/ParS/Xre antitoxin family protein [Gemmatimonadota bacterium]|nr:MbcA/ParS/Xre antitoxin family protein [Gemmatimonadota bacterium]